jgi:hypothetical protein
MQKSGYKQIVLLSLAMALMSSSVHARDPEIRMYKMTHDGHSVKYTLLGKGDNPGCHNTPYRYNVYKLAVIGFNNCSVYAEKDCDEKSILPVYWKQKESKKSTRMKQGTRWFLAPDASEVGVASWSCGQTSD